MPCKLRLDQVELLLASQIYTPIFSEILEDIANLVTNSWEILSNEESSSLSQFTNTKAKFFNSFSSFSSFSSSLSSDSDSKINLVLDTNLIELNLDSKPKNLELEKSELKVKDQYWRLFQIVKWVNTTKYLVIYQLIIYTFATFDNQYKRKH